MGAPNSVNERCWFLFGKKIGKRYIGFLKYHSEGSPAQVAFNWAQASKDKLIGFLHTHPGGFPGPSARDDKTMKAWVRAEGKPLLCGIESDGVKRFFLYYKSYRKSIEAKQLSTKVIGNMVIAKDTGAQY